MAANYAIGTIGYDTTFELNEFNEPRIRSEIETVKDVLLFVLFAKPGQYPSLPQIGMDVGSDLYEFYDELDIDDFKSQLIEQCDMLGMYISSGNINIQKLIYKDKPSMIIDVQGTETFPPGYKHDQIGDSDRYMIGITYDELNNMIYSVNS